MRKGSDFTWLFLDLNSYFASVEQQDNPSLRGKPVIVIPSDTDFTCAIAASTEAKLYGIKTGTSVRDAKKMCPHLHIILAQHQKYLHYHNRIISEVSKHTPINTVYSIDELSSFLPPAKRNEKSVKTIAQNIKNGIWNNVGIALSCSIGVAPNSLLAKIASDFQKPNGLTLITHENLQHFHEELQLRDIPGIGHNMQRRLHRAHITSLPKLCAASPKHMRKIWGSVQGERLWYLLQGYDLPEPRTQNRYMIGHSRVIDPQHRTPNSARIITQRLTEKAAQRLRREDYHCAKITFSCRYNHIHRWYDERQFEHTQDSFTLLQHVNDMWRMFESNTTPELIKKTSVSLQHLRKKEEITQALFVAKEAKSSRHPKLNQAIDALQEKYKQNIVTIGAPIPQQKHQAKDIQIGGKIAFSRIPEEHEFW